MGQMVATSHWIFNKSLEIPRDLLNGFDLSADSDMSNEVHVEVVSDEDGGTSWELE